ncbi:hypothetical protein Lalb_Chr01g0020701 [Lupinus albus]|uniref:Uncharacterized protein n=1 Tax=Lupinus albus TaxID=3870 RepID=A0A6A4R7R2_LUPAL|nr:hypothetical protein Lalb_Chr01g0020701 [Lupinus albus]
MKVCFHIIYSNYFDKYGYIKFIPMDILTFFLCICFCSLLIQNDSFTISIILFDKYGYILQNNHYRVMKSPLQVLFISFICYYAL